VLEKRLSDIMLRHSLQLEPQPLDSDLETFRRQSPDRRPAIQTSKPEIATKHPRLPIGE